MFVAPTPFDDERNLFVLLPLQRVDVARAPDGLMDAEVHLELRYHVERTYPVLCAAQSIHCLLVPVSIPSSMSLQVELTA